MGERVFITRERKWGLLRLRPKQTLSALVRTQPEIEGAEARFDKFFIS
jgi:hypothetical protein